VNDLQPRAIDYVVLYNAFREVQAAARLLGEASAVEDSNPEYDAGRAYAEDRLAHATLALVTATDAMPTHRQPIGWRKEVTT
jgi:hypothetical protein